MWTTLLIEDDDQTSRLDSGSSDGLLHAAEAVCISRRRLFRIEFLGYPHPGLILNTQYFQKDK